MHGSRRVDLVSLGIHSLEKFALESGVTESIGDTGAETLLTKENIVGKAYLPFLAQRANHHHHIVERWKKLCI